MEPRNSGRNLTRGCQSGIGASNSWERLTTGGRGLQQVAGNPNRWCDLKDLETGGGDLNYPWRDIKVAVGDSHWVERFTKVGRSSQCMAWACNAQQELVTHGRGLKCAASGLNWPQNSGGDLKRPMSVTGWFSQRMSAAHLLAPASFEVSEQGKLSCLSISETAKEVIPNPIVFYNCL